MPAEDAQTRWKRISGSSVPKSDLGGATLEPPPAAVPGSGPTFDALRTLGSAEAAAASQLASAQTMVTVARQRLTAVEAERDQDVLANREHLDRLKRGLFAAGRYLPSTEPYRVYETPA